MLAWVGYPYLVVDIMLAFIVFELVVSAIGARMLLRAGEMRQSNMFGKAKMIAKVCRTELRPKNLVAPP